MSHRITLQDIADRLEISKVTVSNALNNKGGVSESLKKKILETAEELGYITKKGAILLLIPKYLFLNTDLFYHELYYEFSTLAERKGFDTTLKVIDTNKPFSEESLGRDSHDFLIMMGQPGEEFFNEEYGRLENLFTVDFYSSRYRHPAILADNYMSAIDGVEYLYRKGHRDIQFFSSDLRTTSHLDRYYGFLRGIDPLEGLAERESPSLTVNHDDMVNGRPFELDEDALPTAFICGSDTAALYLYGQLRNRGIGCPEDVSILTFDNTKRLTDGDVMISSLAFSNRRMSEAILQRLIGNDKDSADKTYLPLRLQERESVKTMGGR